MKEKWHLPVDDPLINGLILVLSWLVLFWMPNVKEWVGYVLVGISAFLFCIGYFRLMAVLPAPETQRMALLWETVASAAGLAVILYGSWMVYGNAGSAGSLIAGTILLIESIVVMQNSFISKEEENGSVDAQGREKFVRRKRVILRVAAVLMLALAVWVACRLSWNEEGVAFITFLLISTIAVWGIMAVQHPA